MALKIPFSFSFLVSNNTEGTEVFDLGYARSLRSLTAYIQEDNLGPVHVDFFILVNDIYKHQIGQPLAIQDGEGFNAKRFQWQKELPMSRKIINKLYFNYANYCGSNVTIQITGFKER